MSYEKIDSYLMQWANRNRLYLYKEYKEIQVRSVEIADKGGRRSQIWIDPPDEDGLVGVHVWNFKKKRRDFLVSVIDLDEFLDNALKIARSWS